MTTQIQTPPLQIDSTRLLNELQILATFTDVEPVGDGTAVTRIVFSPDDLRARAWLKELATTEDFKIRDDAVGNIFIRWLGTDPTSPPSPPAPTSTPSLTPVCTTAPSASSAASKPSAP